MAKYNTAIRGTADVLPDESYKWQYVEGKMLETAKLFGFNEIRVPVFEHTEVFTKNVGETTDVVQKEMYTFTDKGDRSITLRPEFTAGVVRSVIEHGLVNGALPVKACYVGGCYRYEKPQAGRMREFHQFGAEMFGAVDPAADAEMILLAYTVLSNLGINNLSLEINSIGCPECRKRYHDALKSFFEARSEELCDTCKDRLERNPMRILDCKSPVCKEIAADAPVMLDYLCDECREHFEGVKKHLSAVGLNYKVNPQIVRGLDYYTKTVFELISGDIGAQSTVCGGGRYDGLVGQMGGPSLPSLGFAMGLERLLMVMENTGVEFPCVQKPDIYVGTMGEAAKVEATKICMALRNEGFSALTDVAGRSVKAQMKYADKIGAAYSTVIGDDELKNGKCVLKDMQTGEQREVTIPDGIVSAIYDSRTNACIDAILEA
ncbi:MAG: histidine--tRNA ligase [Ruminococcaceae bacterium]|nr:histidine--tRNA ligase [Oscillospiraceae bacterium]